MAFNILRLGYYAFLTLIVGFFLQPIFWIPYFKYWDHRVMQLCEERGDPIVFEQLKLSKTDAVQLGIVLDGQFIRIPPKDSPDAENAEYVWLSKKIYLKRGNPNLVETVVEILRVSDQFTMGRQSYFSRTTSSILVKGSSGCLSEGGEFETLEESIFIIDSLRG